MHLARRDRLAGMGYFASLLLAASMAGAQPQPTGIDTPLRDFALPPAELPEQPPAGPILPPPPLPPEDDQLSGALRIQLREFRITGNSVFNDAQLAEVLAPYTKREITSAELQAARQALTVYYVERGYVNSGAVIPDQKVTDGIVELRIIEGYLTDVEVEGARWFLPSTIEKRLMIEADRPLQVERLEQRLQLLQQHSRIRRVNAQLGPGAARGEAVLRVRIEEELPVELGLDFANDEPASVGELAAHVRARLTNLAGRADVLSGDFSFSEGLTDVQGRYSLPLNKWDTTLDLRIRHSESEIIEEPFDLNEFESWSTTYGIGLLQPLYRTPSTELRIAMIGEWRRSRTSDSSGGFSFPGSGADIETGRSTISVLRLGGEWIQRTRSRVLALRSLVNVGLPVLGATENPGGLPDSRFVSWLTQFQWAQRFPDLSDVELLFRTDLQLANDPLMPMEQIAVGGMRSVRGYRENQLVRDQAVIGSIEVRFPLYRSAGGRHIVQLAPFLDIGHAWNEERDTPSPRTIAGLGAGLRYRFHRLLLAEFYYAEQLRSVPDPAERSLQDRGIHFRLRFDPL
jgi:hemolysin activation/secretion protein